MSCVQMHSKEMTVEDVTMAVKLLYPANAQTLMFPLPKGIVRDNGYQTEVITMPSVK